MEVLQIILIAIGVSMDAFAVSICKGLACHDKPKKTALLCGIWFGLFQMIMPIIGFLVGSLFADFIESFDHWIAFILLAFLGGKMLKDVFSKENKDKNDNLNDLSFSKMLILAIATSIDALAVGLTFAMINTNIYLAIPIIGICTFMLSAIGALIGKKCGEKHKKIATIIGGIILILLGIKILIEHLFF